MLNKKIIIMIYIILFFLGCTHQSKLNNYIKKYSPKLLQICQSYNNSKSKESLSIMKSEIDNFNKLYPEMIFFIIDNNGIIIHHPSTTGKNVFNIQDEKSNYFVQELLHKKNGSIIYKWKTGNYNSKKFLIFHSTDSEEYYVVCGGTFN